MINIKNRYEITDDHIIIYLKRRDGTEMETYVSLSDFEKLKGFKYSWCPAWRKGAKRYYAQATIYLGTIDGKAKYTTVKLHDFLMDAKEGEEVDHMNHNGLDNRRENLRITIKLYNSKNRKSKNSNNSSGYRNVSWVNNKWIVQLQIEGKNTTLGKFDDVHEAGMFAEEMRNTYYGEFQGVS